MKDLGDIWNWSEKLGICKAVVTMPVSDEFFVYTARVKYWAFDNSISDQATEASITQGQWGSGSSSFWLECIAPLQEGDLILLFCVI